MTTYSNKLIHIDVRGTVTARRLRARKRAVTYNVNDMVEPAAVATILFNGDFDHGVSRP